MSSGAKRPPAEVSAFGPLGPSPCKPKRRKQSTPVRIYGDNTGTETPLPPPSPNSPHEHLLQTSPDHTSHPQTTHLDKFHVEAFANVEAFGRYVDPMETPYEKSNHTDIQQHQQQEQQSDQHQHHQQQQLQLQQHKEGGFFQKYREQVLDDEIKCNDGGLSISRVGDVGASASKCNDDSYRSDDVDNKLNAYVIKNNVSSNKCDEATIGVINSFKNEKIGGEERPGETDRYNNGNQYDEKNYNSVNNLDLYVGDLRESPEVTDMQHYTNKLQVNGRHPCGKCGILFSTMESLELHFETEHMEKNDKNSQIKECKKEPYDVEDGRASSGPNSTSAVPDPRVEAWSAEFQAKMADIYKNALSFPHDVSKESVPPNFNPLCPPFPLFSTAVPPQRPMMEPIRIFNPEAYCELCSKEFCNKYFLKTHKANKHGIYESAPSNSNAEGLNLDSSFMPAFASSALKFKNNMMLADYAKSYEAALLASQRHKAKIQRMMEEARDLDKTNVDNQSSSLNMPLNTRHINIDDIRSSSDDNTIPENFIFKGDIRHDQEETFMTPTPRKLSPDSSKRARDSGFNSDILRRLGVINPEAFCKICCKEYCNKYFLKTHKIKRHGLLPSPTDKYKDKETTSAQSEGSERKEGQTSPLNLIMGEENQDKFQQSPELIISTKPPSKPPSLSSAHNIRPLSTHSIDSSIPDDKKESSNDELGKNDNIKQSPTTIFISEDLQKLQTMISQLNDLSVNKIVECYICKKEFENNYILQFHMMSDHGISVSGPVDAFNFPSVSNDETNSDNSQQKAMCTICEKEFGSIGLLKKHIDEFHAPKSTFGDPKSSVECLPSDKEGGMQRERRASMSLTPTNSYCEICNKELCNKYFMKTHMQRMHGIEIENGTQIGGVICDICNKELCSKYFLRVHKHNTHGIVEPGAPLPQMRNMPVEPESFNAPQSSSPLKPPSDPNILTNRFIAHFIEVCPFCSKRFRTSKWLKAHLLSDHGKAGIDKWKELEVQYKTQAKMQSNKNNKQMGNTIVPENSNSNASTPNNVNLEMQERLPFYSKMNEPKILNLLGMNNPEMKTYNCSYCPFSTSILSFLYVHEKSHSQSTEMDILCPMCSETFTKPEALQIHIITAHSLPEWRDRPGVTLSPTSNRECQSRQMKSPPLDADDTKDPVVQTSNGNKTELFECYECDFKSCNFGEMEMHLKNQHCAIKGGTFDVVPDADGDSFNDDIGKKMKMPAIYAVPKGLDGEGDATEQTSITMQPFVIEENTSEVGGGKFVPSVVFLPVRRRATGMITISFNLTPA